MDRSSLLTFIGHFPGFSKIEASKFKPPSALFDLDSCIENQFISKLHLDCERSDEIKTYDMRSVPSLRKYGGFRPGTKNDLAPQSLS